jgi:hypothetical protein
MIERVRAAVAYRDFACRVLTDTWWNPKLIRCAGPLEWAHLGQKRRCFTRGMAPEERHATSWTAMLCKRHHDMYDAHKFDLEPTTDQGADGPLVVKLR